MLRVFSPLLVGVFVALLVCAAPSGAAPGDLVLAGDSRGPTVLGPLRPRANATSAAAIRAFGPDYYVGRGCRFIWSRIGLMVVMANFSADPDPCAFAQVAYIGGPNARRWRTTRGLRIGSSFATLRRLYPATTRHGSYWWLVRGYFPGIGPFSVISARVTAERVVQFRVWIGGAGE